ncbi:zinc finger protein 25-like [Coccinella septempunctata]|uniref:zinc finger protein 25-like n=1 Tax=Coccinella septempunctata TaxID=41139 RepID=UPI001D066FBE|nr:zinc finger protein 25-like [Coccinella septempunctata]
MNKTTCCVCFKGNAPIPLSVSDSNNETISSKLRKVVSEVPWEDTFTICPQCLKTLDIVLEFRNACIKSSLIRLEQGESESTNESHIKQNGSSSDEEIKEVTGDSSERTLAVTCEICKVELNSNEHLYKHNKEIHQHRYENGLLCVEEKDRVPQEMNDDYFSGDNESFSINEGLVENSDVFICFHCNKSFKRKILLAEHIQVKHSKEKIVKKESTDSSSDERPIDNIHCLQTSDDKLDSDKKELFICSKCNKCYKNKKVMFNHMVTCDGVKRHSKINFTKDFSKNECENCGRFYTTVKILRAHMKQCKTKVSSMQEDRCYICDMVLKCYEDKCEHVLNEHNINLKINNTCQYCYKQFLCNESLQTHMEDMHKNKGEIWKKIKNYVERSYSCEVCSVIFGYVKEVIEHCVKEHHMDAKSVKPYLCDKCNTRFTSSANLIQHKQYHKGERTHVCSFCGKSFITKSDLTVHEYTHLNRRNYKCEICEKAFNTNKNLRSHILVVHTDASLWKYQCNLCDKKFPLKSGYDQHIKRHSGDKRFKCLVCEKSFISSSELKKHKKFHSDERAFKCSHCNKEYKDRRVYEIHLTKVHGIGNAKIPIRVRKFACHICPGTFFDKQKLFRHMCTHTGIKPFVCNICNKRFSDKSYLKHHSKVVHNVMDVEKSEVQRGSS